MSTSGEELAPLHRVYVDDRRDFIVESERMDVRHGFRARTPQNDGLPFGSGDVQIGAEPCDLSCNIALEVRDHLVQSVKATNSPRSDRAAGRATNIGCWPSMPSQVSRTSNPDTSNSRVSELLTKYEQSLVVDVPEGTFGQDPGRIGHFEEDDSL